MIWNCQDFNSNSQAFLVQSKLGYQDFFKEENILDANTEITRWEFTLSNS